MSPVGKAVNPLSRRPTTERQPQLIADGSIQTKALWKSHESLYCDLRTLSIFLEGKRLPQPRNSDEHLHSRRQPLGQRQLAGRARTRTRLFFPYPIYESETTLAFRGRNPKIRYVPAPLSHPADATRGHTSQIIPNEKPRFSQPSITTPC